MIIIIIIIIIKHRGRQIWLLETDLTLKNFGVWVVRHHDITYKLGAYLGDKIVISTYIKKVKGPISERIVEFHDSKEEKLLVKVVSKWCYLNDSKTRQVSHIPEFINKIFDPIDSKVK